MKARATTIVKCEFFLHAELTSHSRSRPSRIGTALTVMAYRETGKWENAMDVAGRVLASNSSEKKCFQDKKPVYNQNASVSFSPTDWSLFLMFFSVYVFLLIAIDCFYGFWISRFFVIWLPTVVLIFTSHKLQVWTQTLNHTTNQRQYLGLVG